MRDKSLAELFAGSMALSKAGRELFPISRSPSTVWRYHNNGVGGVFLKAWRIGKHWFTNKEAVEEFLQALNAQQPARPADVAAETAANGREAKKALDGILGGQSA